MDDHLHALRIGTELDGKYVVELVLGSGGFGIVYQVRHRHLGTVYAVKEFLPTEAAGRFGETVCALSTGSAAAYAEGLGRFLEEARQLVQFSGHPNIVRCVDFFEGNGTAYLVMEYEDGLSLRDLLAQREGAGRPLTEEEALGLLLPLLEGLAVVHAAGVLHRDIKPGNVYIRKADEQPVLLDFGSSKADYTRHRKSSEQTHTPGYAALEQVSEEGALGPWTDLYGVGALLYRVMTGKEPPRVEQRAAAAIRGGEDPLDTTLVSMRERVSPRMARVIRACTTLDESHRLRSVGELLAFMPSEPHRETQGATAGDAAVECKQKVDGRSVAHWRRGARAVFLFVLLLGGSGWLFVTELKGRAAERVTAEREAAAREAAEREAAEREAAEREAAAREAAALEIAARAEGERLAKIAAEKAQREAEAAAAAKAAEERRALAAAERERWLVARTGEFVGESNRFRCNITSRKPAGSSDDSLWFRIVRSDERSSTYVFTDEITGNLRRVGPESNLFQGVLPREQKTYSPTLGHLRDSDRFAEVAVRISIVPSDATAYWYAAGETEFSVRGLLGSCSARRE